MKNICDILLERSGSTPVFKVSESEFKKKLNEYVKQHGDFDLFKFEQSLHAVTNDVEFGLHYDNETEELYDVISLSIKGSNIVLNCYLSPGGLVASKHSFNVSFKEFMNVIGNDNSEGGYNELFAYDNLNRIYSIMSYMTSKAKPSDIYKYK